MNKKKDNILLSISLVITAGAIFGLVVENANPLTLVFGHPTTGKIIRGIIIHGDIQSANLIRGQIQNNIVNHGEIVGANITGATIIDADIDTAQNGTLSIQDGSNKAIISRVDGGIIHSALIRGGIMANGLVIIGTPTPDGKITDANITKADIQGATLKSATIDEVTVNVANADSKSKSPSQSSLQNQPLSIQQGPTINGGAPKITTSIISNNTTFNNKNMTTSLSSSVEPNVGSSSKNITSLSPTNKDFIKPDITASNSKSKYQPPIGITDQG